MIMKRTLVAVFIFVYLIMCNNLIIAHNDSIETYYPDYNIKINGKSYKSVTDETIIEYNGRTYLALKDWSKALGMISYDDKYTSLKSPVHIHIKEGILVDNMDAAKEIGTALAKDKYADKLNEKTIIVPMEIELSGAFAFYSLYIFFDGTHITAEQKDDWDFCKQNADEEIRYFVRSGEISYCKKTKNGFAYNEGE